MPEIADYKRSTNLSAADRGRVTNLLQTRFKEVFDFKTASRSIFAEVKVVAADKAEDGKVIERRFLAYAVMLVANGIRVLHGESLPPGTPMTVMLDDRSGHERAITGSVFEARVVDQRLFMVSVRFAKRVELQEYLPALIGNSSDPSGDTDLDITGTVLFVEDQPMEQDLVKLHLRRTGIRLRFAANPAEAETILKSEAIDMIVTDLTFEKGTGEDVMRAAREAGFRGPMLVLTTETQPQRLAKARSAGACEVLRKPYKPQELRHVMKRELRAQGTPAIKDEPIYSTMDNGGEMSKVVAEYIRRIQEKVAELQQSVADGNLHTVQQIATTFKATGVGYGFEDLTTSADRVITGLASSYSIEETMTEINRMVHTARRLKVRGRE